MLFKTVAFACMIACFGGLAFAQGAKGGSARQFELIAESPKFWDLFTQGSHLEKVATGFGFTGGTGLGSARISLRQR